MENEIWKPVVGFEGLYEISNLGRIKSIPRRYRKEEKIMKTRFSVRGGYESVILCKERKKYSKRIHRLVAEAFIPNPGKLPVINHKDENVRNNNVDNLEWCDLSYNYYYSYYRHPERREMMMKFLIDEEGHNISPWSKKGVPHTCKKRVAIVNDSWEIVLEYECPAVASQETGVSISNIITACEKNKNRKRKYIRDGKVFVFIED